MVGHGVVGDLEGPRQQQLAVAAPLPQLHHPRHQLPRRPAALKKISKSRERFRSYQNMSKSAGDRTTWRALPAHDSTDLAPPEVCRTRSPANAYERGTEHFVRPRSTEAYQTGTGGALSGVSTDVPQLIGQLAVWGAIQALRAQAANGAADCRRIAARRLCRRGLPPSTEHHRTELCCRRTSCCAIWTPKKWRICADVRCHKSDADVRSSVLGQDNQQTCIVAKQRAAASGAVSAALWKCCAAACSSPTDAAYAPVRI